MSFTIGTNEGCLSGHHWHGSSICSLCGARLRCECGAYVREDNVHNHIERCHVISQLAALNRTHDDV